MTSFILRIRIFLFWTPLFFLRLGHFLLKHLCSILQNFGNHFDIFEFFCSFRLIFLECLSIASLSSKMLLKILSMSMWVINSFVHSNPKKSLSHQCRLLTAGKVHYPGHTFSFRFSEELKPVRVHISKKKQAFVMIFF